MTVSSSGMSGRAVALPVEGALGHDAFGHGGAPSRVADDVRDRPAGARTPLAPVDLAVDGGGVGIDQQLGRIAAQTLGRVPRAVHPQAVALAGADVREEPVPDVRRAFGQFEPRLRSPSASKRQTSTASAISEDTATLSTLARGRGTQGKGAAAQWLHRHALPTPHGLHAHPRRRVAQTSSPRSPAARSNRGRELGGLGRRLNGEHVVRAPRLPSGQEPVVGTHPPLVLVESPALVPLGPFERLLQLRLVVEAGGPFSPEERRWGRESHLCRVDGGT